MASNYIDKERVHQRKILGIIFGTILVIAVIYICAKASYIAEHSGEDSVTFSSLLAALYTIGVNPTKISFKFQYFKTAFVPVVLLITFFGFNAYDTRIRDRHKESYTQHGTAKFMTTEMLEEFNKKFNKPFGSKEANSQSNIILSKNIQVSMECEEFNKNVMVIGGPGTGKSWAVVRPNLLQEYGSYVITDPSAELLSSTGKFFEDRNYRIRVLNLVDMAHSNTYNPFRYIEKEEDVMTLINCLINCTSDGQKSSDPFWEKSEMALLEAIIFYLIRYRPIHEQNFSMVSRMLASAKADKNGNSKLDNVFNKVRKQDPDDICVRQYDIFKQASDKTAQSILITAAVRLSPFNIDAVKNLTSTDQMELTTVGDIPTVTYIIVPQGDTTYSFLVNMMYSQMFSSLYEHATKTGNIPLPYQVRFILDEFANIGVIPNFQQKLTTMRKYGLSCMIFIQAIAQIKNLYKDDWETIMGACSMLLYLGGNEPSTHKVITEMAGKETIRVKSLSNSKNSNGGGSDNKNYGWQARDLLTVDEVRRLKAGYVICMITGQQPIYEERYDTKNHPNYKYLGNSRTGQNLYVFDYCNAKSSSIAKLEKNKRALEEEEKKKQSLNTPESKPITPSEPLDEDDMKEVLGSPEKVQSILNRTSNVPIDIDAFKETNMTVGTIENGKRKQINYKEPGKVILAAMNNAGSASSVPKGGVTAAESGADDIMNDLVAEAQKEL